MRMFLVCRTVAVVAVLLAVPVAVVDAQTLSAEATFTEQFTNTIGGALPFEYSFALPGPVLTIADFAGLEDTDVPTVTAEFDDELVLENVGSLTARWYERPLPRSGCT